MVLTPTQFILFAVVLIAGLLLGYASRPSARKWKRKVAAQSESFTAYHDEAEDRIRAARDRAKALEAEAAALRADREEAERTIAALRGEREQAERTIATLESERAARPALTLVEPPVPVVVEPVAEVEGAAEPDEPALAEPVAHEDPVSESEEPPAPAPALAEPVAEVEPVSEPVAQAMARPAFGFAALAVQPEEAPSEPVSDDTPRTMTPTPSAGEPAPIGPAETAMPVRGWFGGSVRDDLTRIRGLDSTLNTRLFGLGVLRFEDLEKLSAEDEMALEQRLALPAGYIAREEWRTQSALLRAGKDDQHAAHFGEVADV